MCINGEFQTIMLDDFVPVKKGTNQIAFTKSGGGEIWVPLLEKAWAKANGGYGNIVAGLEPESLKALTGAPTEMLMHKDY